MSPSLISQEDWTHELRDLGYRPARDRTADFASEDGSILIEVLERPRTAVRDLRAKLLQVAASIVDERVKRAILLLVVGRLTQKRLRDEWDGLTAVLRPEVAARLALVAVGRNFQLCLPEDSSELTQLAGVGRSLLDSSANDTLPRMAKSLEVLKVLLVRWLLGQGPIARGEIGKQAGCSYPTVANAIKRLGRVIHEHSNRSVELRAFPQEAWHELVALSPTHRARIAYSDRTGRRADPEGLLRRLRKLKPPHVALGGVVAAHHWDPHFDLRGMPRLDISVSEERSLDLGFLRRLDPGLGRQQGRGSPLLVVHPLRRPAALFVPGDDLPVADPVETLLDLSEMRLIDQSNALVERLRRRAPETP